MDKKEKTKLVVAIVCLVVAGGVVAYSTGLLDSVVEKPPVPNEDKLSPEEKKDFEQKLEEARKRPPSSRG